MLYSPQTVRLSLDTSSLKVNNTPISGTIRTTVNNNLILEGVVSQTGDTAGPVRLVVYSISDGYNSAASWASQPVTMNPNDNVRFYVSFIPPHSGDYAVQAQTQLGGPPSSVPLVWATITGSTITIGVFGSQGDINRIPQSAGTAQVLNVQVNGVNIGRSGVANISPSNDVNVTIQFKNASTSPLIARAWVTNIGSGCTRTTNGCYAAPNVPGYDGNGGFLLAPNQTQDETVFVAYNGDTLQLQAEAQYQDSQGQYHVDDTWPFAIGVPGTVSIAPPTGQGTIAPPYSTYVPPTPTGTGSPIDTGTGTGDGNKKDKDTAPVDWMPIIVVGAVGAAIIGLLVVVLRPQHSF